MIVLLIVIAALVIAGVVAAVRAASIDGYRRMPYTPIARNIDPVQR